VREHFVQSRRRYFGKHHGIIKSGLVEGAHFARAALRSVRRGRLSP
jgi:hypothetical protein